MDDENLRQLFEETRRHLDVVAEGLHSEIQQLAEGLVGVHEGLASRFDELQQEIKSEFAEVRAMIKFSYTELDRRVRGLEEGVSSLQTRVERLEAGTRS